MIKQQNDDKSERRFSCKLASLFCIVLLPETEMVRFELTRRFLDLTVFKTDLLNLLSTSP